MVQDTSTAQHSTAHTIALSMFLRWNASRTRHCVPSKKGKSSASFGSTACHMLATQHSTQHAYNTAADCTYPPQSCAQLLVWGRMTPGLPSCQLVGGRESPGCSCHCSAASRTCSTLYTIRSSVEYERHIAHNLPAQQLRSRQDQEQVGLQHTACCCNEGQHAAH